MDSKRTDERGRPSMAYQALQHHHASDVASTDTPHEAAAALDGNPFDPEHGMRRLNAHEFVASAFAADENQRQRHGVAPFEDVLGVIVLQRRWHRLTQLRLQAVASPR